jgi:soluble lytic murein transglycosylase
MNDFGTLGVMKGMRIIILCLCCVFPSMVNAADIVEQRLWFKQARQALNEQDIPRYEQLYQKLNGYPLRPYLDIWSVQKKLSDTDDALVMKILDQYSSVPASIDLRIDWIRQLATRKQWNRVSTELKTHPKLLRYLKEINLLSQWHTDQKALALKLFSTYWLKHKNIPKKLRLLEQAWLEAGHPTRQEKLSKIIGLIKHGKWSLAHQEADGLNKNVNNTLQSWQELRKNPGQGLTDWVKQAVNSPFKQSVLKDIFRRLSRQGADKTWVKLQEIEMFIDDKTRAKLAKRIALRGAKQHLPESAKWLMTLPDNMKDNETRAWQARIFMMQNQWKKALDTIEAMPGTQQMKSRWQYWKARILERMGHQEDAIALHKQLATERGYYSFLSAEHIGMPYKIVSQEYEVDSSLMLAFAQREEIIRAREWVNLGEERKARRELRHVLKGADKSIWLMTMYMASSWKWYDQVIQAAWKSGAVNALEKRFPLAYDEAVDAAVTTSGLDKSLIWSVIRQESAFNVKANSRVGASGLMQLMPNTARQIANKHHLKLNMQNIFNPRENIQLGSFYLADMLQLFKGSVVMVLAAYNAGPHRVKQWNKRIKTRDATLWAELIPFNETRRYVQQIIAFMIVYDWRQQKGTIALQSRLKVSKINGAVPDN